MNKKAINWILLLVLSLIWGSSFILMKRGLEVYSSDEVAALRILIAFLFLLPLVFKYVKRSHLKHWKAFLVTGTLGNFIPAFLFTKAETGISSSLAGMLNSLTPLFTLVLGILFFQLKTKRINIIGVMIGFIGAVGLVSVGSSANSTDNFLFAFYIMIATICYAISVNVIKKYLHEVNSIAATIWTMLFIGALAFVYLFGFTHFTVRLTTNIPAVSSLGFISILAIFGTAISVIFYNVLIRRTNSLFSASVNYLIPFVAIAWGALDGETIKAAHLLWIALILLGVYWVNKKITRLNTVV